MIRNFAKQLTTFVRPAAFSTYKVKGNPPFKSQTQDTSKPKVYRKEDAEKIYEQFLEENPQDPNEQSQKIISKEKASYNKEDSFSFDPYRVLGLTTGASKDKIDQAYRDLAVKYHPKNNSSFEAAERFIQISRAYEMLSPMKDTEKKAKSGYSVFMSDINSSVKDYLGFETKMKGSKGKNEQPEAKNAQVYTESKNYKRVGNDRQVVIEKEYNDNGKLIKFTQVENFKDDGTVEVTETFDDGTQQKLYKFTKNSKGQEIEGSRSSSDGDGNKA